MSEYPQEPAYYEGLYSLSTETREKRIEAPYRTAGWMAQKSRGTTSLRTFANRHMPHVPSAVKTAMDEVFQGYYPEYPDVSSTDQGRVAAMRVGFIAGMAVGYQLPRKLSDRNERAAATVQLFDELRQRQASTYTLPELLQDGHERNVIRKVATELLPKEYTYGYSSLDSVWGNEVSSIYIASLGYVAQASFTLLLERGILFENGAVPRHLEVYMAQGVSDFLNEIKTAETYDPVRHDLPPQTEN